MGSITSFEQFLIRVLTVLFWASVFVPMILFPIIFLVIPYFDLSILYPLAPFNKPLTPNDVLKIMADPTLVFPYLTEWSQSDFFRVVVFPGFTTAALVATGVIWWERKFLAKIHNRIGPLYAGRVGGVLQPIADLFKLLFKEIVIPEKSDKPLFIGVPIFSLAVAGALLAVVPLSPTSFIAKSDLSVLIFFAVMSFFPIVVLIGSWASSNKFSFIGGLRALHQLISFEIPLILSVLGVVVVAGSLDIMKIVETQSKVWFVAPLFIGAFIFYLASLAELERIPFDLPEADSEIVAGWLTEYSGMAFGVIQLAIYIKFYALAVIFAHLFLGGWLGPPFLPPEAWTIIKAILVMTSMMVVRGSFPRVRIDQLIRIGWVWLIPLAFVNLFIAIAVGPLITSGI